MVAALTGFWPDKLGSDWAYTSDLAVTCGALAVALGLAVPGTEREIDLPAVARAATDPANLPEGMAPGLDSSIYNLLDVFTLPNGCHIAEVEIDPDTGLVTLQRYIPPSTITAG